MFWKLPLPLRWVAFALFSPRTDLIKRDRSEAFLMNVLVDIFMCCWRPLKKINSRSAINPQYEANVQLGYLSPGEVTQGSTATTRRIFCSRGSFSFSRSMSTGWRGRVCEPIIRQWPVVTGSCVAR